MWFKFPLHIVDTSGQLDKFYPKGDIHNAVKNSPSAIKSRMKEQLPDAYQLLDDGKGVSLEDLAPYFTVDNKTHRRWANSLDEFEVKDSIVYKT